MSSNGRKGFTLIELLAIIVIIAVMSALAVPAYDRYYQHAQFQATVQNVLHLGQWARLQAIENGGDAVLRVDPADRIVTASVNIPPVDIDMPQELVTGSALTLSATSVGPLVQVVPLPQSAQVQVKGNQNSTGEPAGTVRFRPDGSCTGGIIQLADSAGHAAVIQMLPATGSVTLMHQDEIGVQGAL